MIEQRLEKLENDIKALKTAMPISGSLVDTYIYRETSTRTLPDNTNFRCTAKFIPLSRPIAQGIIEFSLYREDWTSSPTWAEDNPLGASIDSGYSIDESGNAVITVWGARSTGDGYTWEPRLTATVYGTIEGNIEFEWS